MALQDVASLTGFAVDSLFFLSLGMSAGYVLERRRQRVTDTEAAIKLAVDALSKIELTRVTVAPQTVRRGETLCITYQIHSDCPTAVIIWLGADCGGSLYETAQDKEVTVQPGCNEVKRWLTIGGDWPIGCHELVVGLWIGQISDPDNSIRLAVKAPAADIEIS